ncbi:MAG: hypothetical protein RIR89_377 [Actinomycetota bacterium]|jgi:hypothetical protein
MKTLPPSQLLMFLAIGLVAGLSSSQLASSLGYSFLLSPNSMLIVLPVIAVAVYIASYPIFRYRKKAEKYETGPRPNRPNPFYAFRVLLVSRAVALTGSLFAGWHLGQLLWLISFSVAPAALVLPTALGLLGGGSMLGGGLLAEFNCRAPRDPGEGTE